MGLSINRIHLSLKKGRLGTRLRSEQDDHNPNPSYIPVANEAARVAAASIGGFPSSAINEVLLDVPTTAHIIGGSPIGESAATGAIDPYHRVYGYEGLHVCDGSVLPANLGVNPSLTITAMTERAMAYWPNKDEADGRPQLGGNYLPAPRIAPKRPAVPTGAPAELRLLSPEP